MSATSPTSRRGRAGPIWPPSSTWPLAGHRLGARRSHAHRAGRKTLSPMAFANRAPDRGVIFHSDRGCQYPFEDFAELARANGVVLSVGRKGECWDNPVAEIVLRHHQARTHRHLFVANEGRTSYAVSSSTSRAGTTRAACTRTLGYLSPAQYEAVHHQRRPSGGIINTSNLSVEPDQAHATVPTARRFRPPAL